MWIYQRVKQHISMTSGAADLAFHKLWTSPPLLRVLGWCSLEPQTNRNGSETRQWRIPTQEMVPTGVSPWLWLRVPQTILGISITVPHMAIVSSRKNQTLARSPYFGESSRKNTGTREDCLFSCVSSYTRPRSKASYVREKSKTTILWDLVLEFRVSTL